MRIVFNITDLVRTHSRAATHKPIAICVALCIGWLVSPDTVFSQVEFRKPDLPQKRTLGGQLVGSTARVQDGLKSIRRNVSNGLKRPVIGFAPEPQKPPPTTSLQPPANIRPPAARPSEPPKDTIADFGDEGFLSVELGRGGLTPYPVIRSDQTDSPTGRESSSGPGAVNSLLANTRQDREELPLPLSGQTDINTDGLEEIRQNFPDGSPRIIRFVAQDEKGNYFNEGPWKVFNQADPPEVVASGTYKQGRMHGQWRRQHDAEATGLFATKPFDLYKGPFLSVAAFHNGQLDGVWSIYDAYQRNIFEISYKDGVRDGTATWWYPNRSKMREATFQDGLLHGEILAWDESEKLVRREEFVEGRRIVRNTTFYRPNQKKTEDYFLDAQLIPDGEDNWWDAKPTPYVPQGSKVQNGSSMKWYENKQPKQQGQYKDGLQVGQFTWWHANGNKQIEGFYVDGKKNRLWTWWYENGMKQFEGVYKDDQPVGRWRSWHADGQLRNEEDFSKQPESKSNDDNDPVQTDPSNQKTVIESPSETLPIPEKSKPAKESETILDESGTEDLEGIEPLKNKASQEPGKENDPGSNSDPDNGSGVGENQNDGSLPSELFKLESAIN